MEYIKKDTEVNLKEFILGICFKWKQIILVSIVMFFLGGGIAVYNGQKVEVQKSEEVNQEASVDLSSINKEKYLKSQGLSETECNNILEALQMVESYSDIYDAQREYLNNSEFMKSEEINVTELKFAVMSDESVGDNVIGYYQSLVKSETLIKYVKEQLNIEMPEKYLEEIIRLDEIGEKYVQNSNSGLAVYVYHSDKDMSEKIAKVIEKWMTTKVEKIYDSSIECIAFNSRLVINGMYLTEKQKINDSMVNSVEQCDAAKLLLNENEQTYFEKIVNVLHEKQEIAPIVETETEQVYNLKGNIIKYGVLGFVLGIFGMVCITALRILYKDKLEFNAELADRYGITVFGGILHSNKKYYNPVDRFLGKIKNNRNILLSEKDNLVLLEENVRIMAQKEEISNILIVGEMDTEIESCFKQIKRNLENTGVQLNIATKSFLESDDSLKAAGKADGVILLETIDTSRFSTIEKEIYVLDSHNIKILGVVTVH